MTSFWIGPGYPHEGYYYAYAEVLPDTVIGGEVFKKLVGSSSSGGMIGSSSYVGALRDNGLGQVYYAEPWASTPALLYDFDVSPGDTISDVYTGGVIVHAVDTLMVNGSPRRRIDLACDNAAWSSGVFWIQGIGCTQGLLHAAVCGSVSGTGELVCMSENEIIQYGSNTGNPGDCSIFLSTVEQTAENADLRVFPVPASDLISVQSTVGGPFDIEALTIDGRSVLRERLVGEVLAVGHLPSGTYVLRVVDAGGGMHVIRFAKH